MNTHFQSMHSTLSQTELKHLHSANQLHPRLKYKCYRYLLIMNNRPFYRVFAQAAVQVCVNVYACASQSENA